MASTSQKSKSSRAQSPSHRSANKEEAPKEEPTDDTGKQPNEREKKDGDTLQLKQFFYVANIIDYGRLVFLWLAVNNKGWWFAFYYILSYALDIFDGIAARMFNQESKLGYYLDMIIDRISSCVCLYLAARKLLSGKTFIPIEYATPLAYVLLVSIVVVEILAHGIVCYAAEVMGIHQKKLGGDWKLVRWYLQIEDPSKEKEDAPKKKEGTKWWLLWACASFEFFGVGLIVPKEAGLYMVALSAPGFIFRAMANTARLFACLPIVFGKEKTK